MGRTFNSIIQIFFKLDHIDISTVLKSNDKEVIELKFYSLELFRSDRHGISA